MNHINIFIHNNHLTSILFFLVCKCITNCNKSYGDKKFSSQYIYYALAQTSSAIENKRVIMGQPNF